MAVVTLVNIAQGQLDAHRALEEFLHVLCFIHFRSVGFEQSK